MMNLRSILKSSLFVVCLTTGLAGGSASDAHFSAQDAFRKPSEMDLLFGVLDAVRQMEGEVSRKNSRLGAELTLARQSVKLSIQTKAQSEPLDPRTYSDDAKKIKLAQDTIDGTGLMDVVPNPELTLSPSIARKMQNPEEIEARARLAFRLVGAIAGGQREVQTDARAIFNLLTQRLGEEAEAQPLQQANENFLESLQGFSSREY